MSAYPSGTVAADLDPPASMDRDDDARYERFISRVDDGLQCPECLSRQGISSEVNLGVACFACRCGARWINHSKWGKAS